MILKRFISKFAKQDIVEDFPKYSTANDSNETISTAAIIDIKDLQIKSLKTQIELLNEKIFQLNLIKNKTAKEVKKFFSTTDLISELFYIRGCELNCREVFENIDKNKLRNKNPNIGTINANLYYMKKKKILKSGKKRGTFKYNFVKNKE